MSRFRRRLTASSEPQQAAGTPKQRHAIFYDVENTSSPDDVSRVMAEIEMNRSRSDTHLVAVGNWRVIGQETARLLARQGAELVHSAPNTGVRDWSDLRIAVDAGIWLGSARPGDMLDVVSDDQAFDAIGDVAATLGVQFRRIPARHRQPVVREQARRSAAGQQASHDDIIGTVRRLTGSLPEGQGSVSLDTLSNALKDSGFVRAPGSHRLVTRLRRMKELRVSPDGLIRLASGNDAGAGGEMATAVAETPKPRRRRGRRGGRRRGGRPQRAGAETADDEADAPEPASPGVAR